MKKTALTFGLFSLVMVATSFTTPATSTSSNKGIINTTLETDGGQKGTGNGRKLDVYSSSDQVNSLNNESNSFGSDSQSSRSRIKLD